ncbi:hypothetical protein IMCC20628_02112 [Hoeflea sp. IMCC20628]|nr:hypothetical protein IMCC20628_02112 [Hoeflea sp. IMCC20628]
MLNMWLESSMRTDVPESDRPEAAVRPSGRTVPFVAHSAVGL